MIVRRYIGVMTLNYFSTGLLASVLSMIMLDKGLSMGGIAFAMGLYSITAAVLEVPSGIAADIWGRKRTFMLSLLITAAAMLTAMRGAVGMMIAVALTGAGRAMASGTIEALFVSRHNAAFSMDKLPKAMRTLALCESVGLASGALLGGFLPSITRQLLPGMGPYDMNLLLRVALSLLLVVLTAVQIPSDRDERPERQRLGVHLRESINIVKQSHALKWILVAMVGLGVVLCALESYWQPLFLGMLGGGDKTGMLGVLSVLYFGAVMAGNIISEKLLAKHKVGEKTMYLAGRAAMLIAMVGAAVIVQPVIFMILYCLMYFCLGASNISEGAMLHREVPDGNRASMLSVQSCMMQTGILASSTGIGSMVEASSIQLMWLAAAAASALLLAPALQILRKKKAEPPCENELAEGQQQP